MITTRRINITLAGVALVLGLFACHEQGLTGSSTVTGPYILRTINGSALPYATVSNATTRTEILDDTITLYQGGTYAESGHSRTTVNGQVTTTPIAVSGSYALLGTSNTLHSGDGLTVTVAQMSGNNLTIVQAGLTWAYRKP